MKGTICTDQQPRHAGRTKPRQNPVESSQDPWMAFLARALLIAVIILMFPKLVDAKPRKSKKFGHKVDSIRAACLAESPCADLVLEESMNCVNRCMSETCYQEIFGDDPLEDGQIDIGRRKSFDACVKEEMRLERVRLREQEREG